MDLSGKLNELVSKIQGSQPASSTKGASSSSEKKQTDEVSSVEKTSVFTDIKNEEAEKTAEELILELEENFSEFLNTFEPALTEDSDIDIDE